MSKGIYWKCLRCDFGHIEDECPNCGWCARGEFDLPPQRKPLTDEQIDALREKHSEGRGAGWRFDFKGFARAIEAAHGIKENT